ncbi:retrovirus-related pol polyprotein from transposon TNT 1-94 [Tanacetum coccineum]
MLNELANDGVNLSKHEINVSFMNSLLEKWLTFSQGLRNDNHTQTFNFADIYGRFVYEDNLIQRRYSDTKKVLITTPLSTPISTAFFFNNVIQDFQENSDDEVDERTGEEYLRDLDIKYHYAKTFDWDEEEVYDEEEVTQVKVLMALADDELTCRDEFLILKQAKLDAVTFQIQNTKLIKLNHALQEQLKEEKRINEKWLTSSKKVSQCISEQIPHQKKNVLSGELLIELSFKRNENENLFVPASIGYDQEMVPKTKDWVERLNPDSKLPNFNTGRTLVPKSQAFNESLETSNTLESSKESEAKFLTPLPPLKILQGASPSSEVLPLTFQPHSPKERPGLGILKHTKPKTQDSSNESVSGTITVNESKQTTPSVPTEVKDTKQELKLNELTKLVQMLIDEKVNSDQKTQESNSKIQKAESSKSVDLSQIKYCTFDDKQGTIFNANKEIVLIAPRRNDVYVLDMSSLSPNGACFFAKASESVNWLWHKRLSHLNFKNINKLSKQNKVLGLPSLIYSKDTPCTSCEKGKYHRASFKTKQNFSIRKCLHLLHMDLFGSVSPMSINHEKYTLVIVDEYSRYTWVHFLRKKSQAPEIIMSFIRMVENQNDVKVKQIRTDNGTEFRNHELESFCDEKGIS